MALIRICMPCIQMLNSVSKLGVIFKVDYNFCPEDEYIFTVFMDTIIDPHDKLRV